MFFLSYCASVRPRPPAPSGTSFESSYMSFIKGNRLYTNKATKQEADQTDKPKRSPARTGSN
ncbi:hypothetical protein LguiA_036105 [Lonicera macranthoides]